MLSSLLWLIPSQPAPPLAAGPAPGGAFPGLRFEKRRLFGMLLNFKKPSSSRKLSTGMAGVLSRVQFLLELFFVQHKLARVCAADILTVLKVGQQIPHPPKTVHGIKCRAAKLNVRMR